MDKNRILKMSIIFAILTVIGILIIVFNKFEFNVNYSKNVRIELNIGKTANLTEIAEIAGEIYKDEIAIVRTDEKFGELVAITVKNTSEDQNTELINKINEKYETNLSADDLKLYYNSNVKGSDLIEPYIVPSIVSGIIILAFFGIRYRKLGAIKIMGYILGIVIGTTLLYMALSSLFRMEINEASIAGGIAIEIFCFVYFGYIFEKRLQEK